MPRAAVPLILLFVLSVGCRESRSGVPETGPPDVAHRAGSAELEDNEAGVEYEAPRLIPAIRAQADAMGESGKATRENLTAFRNGVGTLVNAMEADLQRSGVSDTGSFGELSDSVMRTFGGGPGSPADLEPADAGKAAAQVRRLIELYGERMRAAAR